jgi:hypothetical protein
MLYTIDYSYSLSNIQKPKPGAEQKAREAKPAVSQKPKEGLVLQLFALHTNFLPPFTAEILRNEACASLL